MEEPRLEGAPPEGPSEEEAPMEEPRSGPELTSGTVISVSTVAT